MSLSTYQKMRKTFLLRNVGGVQLHVRSQTCKPRPTPQTGSVQEVWPSLQHYLQENSDFPAAFVIIILPIISLLCSQGRMNLPQLSTNKVVYASLDFSVSHSLVSLSHTHPHHFLGASIFLTFHQQQTGKESPLSKTVFQIGN